MNRDKWEAAVRLVGVGFYIGVSIMAGVWLGLWLDTKFNTRPWLVLAGLFLGLLLAGYGVYRMLLPLLGNNKGKGDS